MDRKEDELFNILEEATPECLQYLHDRLELMKRVADNSIATAIRELSKNLNLDGTSKPKVKDSEQNYSKVSKNVLQLLRNELKLLEMLAHSCKEFKNTLENITATKTKVDDATTSIETEEIKKEEE